MGGFPRFGKGCGTVKENCLRGQVKEIYPKCIILEVSGVIRVDSGMFHERLIFMCCVVKGVHARLCEIDSKDIPQFSFS